MGLASSQALVGGSQLLEERGACAPTAMVQQLSVESSALALEKTTNQNGKYEISERVLLGRRAVICLTKRRRRWIV